MTDALYTAEWFKQYDVTTPFHRHILTGLIQTALHTLIQHGHDLHPARITDGDLIVFDKQSVLQQASRTADFIRYLTREQDGYSLMTVCRTVLPIAKGTEGNFLMGLGSMLYESRNCVAPVFGRDKRYVQMQRIDFWCKLLPPVYASLTRQDDSTVIFALHEDDQ